MISQSDIKKELVEIQSLAKSKFEESVYQRLLVTTITLLTVISLLILTISFFLRMIYSGETLLGDFLLNLGTDFIGSTIIFVVFSITLKSNDESSINKKFFQKVLLSVFGVGIIALVLVFFNNQGALINYRPGSSESVYQVSYEIRAIISSYAQEIYSDADSFYVSQFLDGGDETKVCVDYLASSSPSFFETERAIVDSGYHYNFSDRLLSSLEARGLISEHFEWYYGQDFVSSFLLNISTQFLGALIIFVGVEQLFQLFERQREVQQAMLEKIEQLSKKIE